MQPRDPGSRQHRRRCRASRPDGPSSPSHPPPVAGRVGEPSAASRDRLASTPPDRGGVSTTSSTDGPVPAVPTSTTTDETTPERLPVETDRPLVRRRCEDRGVRRGPTAPDGCSCCCRPRDRVRVPGRGHRHAVRAASGRVLRPPLDPSEDDPCSTPAPRGRRPRRRSPSTARPTVRVLLAAGADTTIPAADATGCTPAQHRAATSGTTTSRGCSRAPTTRWRTRARRCSPRPRRGDADAAGARPAGRRAARRARRATAYATAAGGDRRPARGGRAADRRSAPTPTRSTRSRTRRGW